MDRLKAAFDKMKKIANESQEESGSSANILSVTARSLDWTNLKATTLDLELMGLNPHDSHNPDGPVEII